MAVLSVVITSLSFFILGLFLLISLNLENVIEQWKDQFEITIYLQDNLNSSEIDSIEKKIEKEHGIINVKYVSKEDALNELRNILKDKEGLLEGLSVNPLPSSFQVKVNREIINPSGIKDLAMRLEKISGIEEVQYGQKWIERLDNLSRLFRYSGFTIGGIVGLAAIFTLSGTIVLSSFSRREEVEIMRLVGATELFVKLPLYIEGIIQGVIGAGLSVLLLYLGFLLVSERINPILVESLGTGKLDFLSTDITMRIMIGGFTVGLLGSLISMAKKVRK